MLKILIWQVSDDQKFQDKALNILEQQHDGIKIVDEVSSEDIAKVDGGDYDIILVVGAKKDGLSKFAKTARQLKLPDKKILGDLIVCIPGFTLEKYRELENSRLSILSVNCIGGLFSHTLGLPFRSPFVNLFLSNGDFLKFLRKPDYYLAETLTYHGQKRNSKDTHDFPVAQCGDILLNMMHYKTFEKSVEAWEKRTLRINWDNLFVMMWSEKLEELEQFDALPYAKKACFVPFKSDLSSAWYVEHRLKEKFPMYVHYVNQTARGKPFFYDPFDMLLYGKKTPLIDA